MVPRESLRIGEEERAFFPAELGGERRGALAIVVERLGVSALADRQAHQRLVAAAHGRVEDRVAAALARVDVRAIAAEVGEAALCPARVRTLQRAARRREASPARRCAVRIATERAQAIAIVAPDERCCVERRPADRMSGRDELRMSLDERADEADGP